MAKSKMLGAQSLRRKIKRMPDAIKLPVQNAVRDAADVVYADALKHIPVDTGALSQALAVRISSDKLGARIGFWEKGNVRRWRKAGWRARFIEFGTKGYNPGDTRTNKRSRTTKKIRKRVAPQPARPFLGPALRNNIDWIVDRIEAAVDLALRRAGSQ